ncbi:MAG: prolyl oligopeptidase family serine peptidase [Actinobacteria bacterium]|nr:prolyl oligopeptidase family serine peptidase [Actinomycetota bacterium]
MPQYPAAPRLDLVDDLHGRAVADPYRWLEDPADERTKEWSVQQAALMDAERADWKLREHFGARVGELLGAGTVSPTYWRGQRAFVMRREPGQQFAILYTIDPGATQERVLLDPMTIDPSGLTTLDSWQPSKEGDYIAYQLSVGGNEESVLYVMDVSTGETVDGPIDRCRYSPVAWIPGGEAFYYVRRIAPELLPEAEQHFHRRVYLHQLGAPTDTDVLVFGAGMTMTNYYGVEVSIDGRWLQVSASEGTEPRNDLWIADLTKSPSNAPAFTLVQGDVDANTGISTGRDGRFYVSTDLDAPRGRVAVCDPATPTSEHWVDLIAEDEDAVLDGFAVLDGPEVASPQLLVTHTRHGISEMTLRDLATGAVIREVELPGAGTISGPIERPEGGPVVWFVYTDNTTVPHVYAFDARTGEVTLAASPPGVVEVPRVFSRQVIATSADGTPVRMIVLSPTEAPDRARPAVLYGYGGFGIPLTPGYSAAILAWVEAGGVWAIANLRGGGEEGEEWHRDGMLGKKQNVYDDFHACAQFLADEGWTTAQQLGVYGGSNGGLLVGAAMTQRPDLMNAVVCTAPLLDMVRYVTSELGPTWTVEYGDPEIPEQLDWLLGYSPYHRVLEGTDYPATMFVVFDNDTRTDPMHGRKMCAAAQHATSGERPVLIRAEGEVGHGARSLTRSIDETAETLSFLARWTGLETL